MDDVYAFSWPPASRVARSWLRWRYRAVLPPEERQRIMTGLYPEAGRAGRWWFRFAAMLALSVSSRCWGCPWTRTPSSSARCSSPR